MRAWIGWGLLLAWVWMPLHAESSCPLASAAAVAAQAQARLQKVQLEDMDDSVGPALRQDIASFKDALAAISDARMACLRDDGTGAAAMVQNDLAAALKANRPAGATPSASGPSYGGDLSVQAQQVAATSGLLVLQWSFGIECGDDNLLLAYAFRDGAWRQVMRWQSGEYKDISGAFGDGMTYLALPGPTPRLAVFHGTPWCTSRWSGFKLDLLSPGETPASPKVLFHLDHGYIRGDFGPALKLRPDGFELRVEVGMRDMDVMTRTGIFRYRVDGEHVSRVQPVAMNGRDFVDEWLQANWSEASGWSDPQQLPALQKAHEALMTRLDADKAPEIATYGAVRACTDDHDKYQVQLDLQASGKSDQTTSRYLLIRSGANSFTMLAVAEAPQAACNGPNLMRKHG